MDYLTPANHTTSTTTFGSARIGMVEQQLGRGLGFEPVSENLVDELAAHVSRYQGS